ncbi:MAG: hypothetical protein JXA77_06810 [Bacteroidales bacterium]|nr:hypothetical protein [Bacteroidales bacterium]MBN2819846.1 hypothetical protein [Bacteroidales bacterium]
MKTNLILLAVVIVFSSFKYDLSGPWNLTRQENLVLYTRPEGFSKTPSPDSADICKIISAQLQDIKKVNQMLKTSFNKELRIYLFNYDEAREKIRTNAGGGAKVKICEMYFTFNKDLASKMDDFIGMHEIVHIVAGNELGYPSTVLMNEGYANAVSNGYKLRLSEDGSIQRTTLEQWMNDFIANNQIIKPSELLIKSDKIPEHVFYPQAGYFVKWMMNMYGVETTNTLYTLKPQKLKKKLFLITGKEFNIIEKEYLNYLINKL